MIIRHVAPVACFFALILVLSLGLPVTGLAATLPLVEASGSSDPSAIQDLPLSERPPQRLPNPLYDKPVQKVVGDIVILECPVVSETTVFFEWRKGEDVVEDLPRFKVFEETGVLKIKNAKITDSGTYVCNAVNGYGQIDVQVQLEVMTIDQFRKKNGLDKNQVPTEEPVTQAPVRPAVPKTPLRPYKPYLVNTKLEDEMMRYVGENATITCKFSGRPTADVRWYFKGEPIHVHLNKSLFTQTVSTEGEFTEGKITIPNVNESTSGRFTCQGTNKKGSKSANIHLVVFPDTRPVIIGDHPLNTTVLEGQAITLHCRVHCVDEPSIQWFRKKNALSSVGERKKVKTDFLTTNIQTDAKGNNLYESILRIPKSNASDAGIYMCTVMNPIHYGIAFKEAEVRVVQPLQYRGPAPFPSRSFLHHPVTFWIIGLAIVLFAIILFTIVIKKTISGTRVPDDFKPDESKQFIKSTSSENQIKNRIPLTPNLSVYSSRRLRFDRSKNETNVMQLNNTGGCMGWVDEQNRNTVKTKSKTSSLSSCQCSHCLRFQNKSATGTGVNSNIFRVEKHADPNEITVIN